MSTSEPLRIPVPRIGFGDRLRRVRIEAKMTQDEFGEAVGLAGATIGRYELVSHQPKTAKVVANSVQLRFGIPAEWLLSGELPSPTQSTVNVRRTRRTVSVRHLKLVS